MQTDDEKVIVALKYDRGKGLLNKNKKNYQKIFRHHENKTKCVLKERGVFIRDTQRKALLLKGR